MTIRDLRNGEKLDHTAFMLRADVNIKETLGMMLVYNKFLPCYYLIRVPVDDRDVVCYRANHEIDAFQFQYELRKRDTDYIRVIYDTIKKRVFVLVKDEQELHKYWDKLSLFIETDFLQKVCLRKDVWTIEKDDSRKLYKATTCVAPIKTLEHYLTGFELDPYVEELRNLDNLRDEPVIKEILIRMLCDLCFVGRYHTCYMTNRFNEDIKGHYELGDGGFNLNSNINYFIDGDNRSPFTGLEFVYDSLEHRLHIPDCYKDIQHNGNHNIKVYWNDMVRFCFKQFGVAITDDIITWFNLEEIKHENI